MNTLPLGPLDNNTYFVCIDMQRLFLEPGEWFCKSGLEILPVVSKLTRAGSEHCVFTRFITPSTPADTHGQWRHYYKRWQSVTRSIIGDDAMHLHEQLRPVGREQIFDKTGHDAFSSKAFARWAESKNTQTLVLFGIETDVCVLATAMSAVDLGIRVVIVTDAVASSDQASHQACLDLIYPRFDQQIDIVDSAKVVAAWSAVND